MEKYHVHGDDVKCNTKNMIAELAGQRNSSQLVDENLGQLERKLSQCIVRLPKKYN